MIREVSDQLIEIQKPIMILNSIEWPEKIWREFKRKKFQKLPKLTTDLYKERPLGFDPEEKIKEFRILQKKVDKFFGKNDGVAKILTRNCQEYMQAVNMLNARGTTDFYKFSTLLYGSTHDHFLDKKNQIYSLGLTMKKVLKGIKYKYIEPNPHIPADKAVRILSKRLKSYFHHDDVRVKLSDGIVSDAAAGSNYIKLKRDIKFTKGQLDIYEVHEGHVHVGTSLNGRAQPYCRWLAVGSPGMNVTQEGLAFTMEILTFTSNINRIEKVNDRIITLHMAEEGADFMDIFRYYRKKGIPERQSFERAHRLFRGTLGKSGAVFTKDLSYERGFIGVYNFLSVAASLGVPYLIPFIFAGKLIITDLPIIHDLYKEKILSYPKYIPPVMQDNKGLMCLMAYNKFLNKLDFRQIEKYALGILKTHRL